MFLTISLRNQSVFAKLAASRLFFASNYGREGSSPADNRHTEEHFYVFEDSESKVVLQQRFLKYPLLFAGEIEGKVSPDRF